MTTEATMADYTESTQFIVDLLAYEADGAPLDEAHGDVLAVALSISAVKNLEAVDPAAAAVIPGRPLYFVDSESSVGRDIHGPFASVEVVMADVDGTETWVLTTPVDLSDADTSRLDLPFATRPPTTMTARSDTN
jgi:hypothetical protein